MFLKIKLTKRRCTSENSLPEKHNRHRLSKVDCIAILVSRNNKI